MYTNIALPNDYADYVIDNFMKRVKGDSKLAVMDVVCDRASIKDTVEKYGVTRQALSKNVDKLREVTKMIVEMR